jgi:hypothetical protein
LSGIAKAFCGLHVDGRDVAPNAPITRPLLSSK